jgi:hypothetical protein
MARMNGFTIRLAGKILIGRLRLIGNRVGKHIRCSSRGSGQSAHNERSREVDFSLNMSTLIQRLQDLRPLKHFLACNQRRIKSNSMEYIHRLSTY